MMSLKILLVMALLNTACGPRSLARLSDHPARAPRALFHPVDATQEEIAAAFLRAEENIDIAMYSMDVSAESPIMRALSSPEIQQRLASSKLAIRMVFEGYGTEEDNRMRSMALEAVGVDVRWLRGGRKVHHKFAVIDSGLRTATTISGSANWSLSSQRFYDESIMIWPEFPGLASQYQKEFNLLWAVSDDVGVVRFPDDREVVEVPLEPGVVPAFNSANFVIRNGQLSADTASARWTLAKTIVHAIEAAEQEIQIATTRIVLRPIYNALLRAAARGVRINLVVNEDQYDYAAIRDRAVMGDCADEWDVACNKEQNFPWFLQRNDYPGKENVQVRIKFFTLNVRVTLAKQMHAKYLVVDQKTVVSGSFNWSHSSEWNHIENVVTVAKEFYPEMVAAFVQDQTRIASQGRANYESYVARIEEALVTGVKTDCGFEPMALSYAEIDWLLAAGERHGRAFKDACL